MDNKKTDKPEEKIEEQIDYKDKYLRALADYDNLLKRTANDRVAFVKYANEELIKELLTVLDGLEKAAEHIKDEGLTLVLKQLQDFLRKNGVSEITSNEKFDPTEMECVETGEGEKDEIIVLNKGYKLYDKMIRPIKVKVVNKISSS